MTYIVEEPYDYKRLATAEVPSLEFLWAFYTPMALGLPLTPELRALTPNPLVIHPPRKGPLPDVFNGKKGVWIVSPNAREAIERLEPSTHTFISVNLQSSKDDQPLGKAFLVYIGLTIDAVDRERTTFGGGGGQIGFAKDRSLTMGLVAIKPELVHGKHLWRGGTGKMGGPTDPFWRYTFCSDELKAAFEEGGLTGWIFHQCI